MCILILKSLFVYTLPRILHMPCCIGEREQMLSDLPPGGSQGRVMTRGGPVLRPLQLQECRPLPELQKMNRWASPSTGWSAAGLASDEVTGLCHFTEQTKPGLLGGGAAQPPLQDQHPFFRDLSTHRAQKKECSHGRLLIWYDEQAWELILIDGEDGWAV